MALLHLHVILDNQLVINLLYLVLVKMEASRTTDLSDISRMLGQANDQELNEVRAVLKMSIVLNPYSFLRNEKSTDLWSIWSRWGILGAVITE
jgi:hypothetical protein